MRFEEFLAWAATVRRERPTILDLAETRIAEGLRALRPLLSISGLAEVHRCDLARTWCELRGLPCEWSARALVCEGVRHALSLLFRDLRDRRECVGLPSDVYPVYWRIAEREGVRTFALETFPDLDLARLFARCASNGVRHVLLPFPWKLHAREWTSDDLNAATAWLAADAGRRLLLDGVYSFGAALGETTRALLATGGVVYLDSLSKGWLHEQVFGVAVVPASDVPSLAPRFRAASPSQANLFAAQALFAGHAATPATVIAELARRRAHVIALLRTRALPTLPAAHGYLVPIGHSAEDGLSKYEVLTIPARIFGVTSDAWSFASALSFPPREES